MLGLCSIFYGLVHFLLDFGVFKFMGIIMLLFIWGKNFLGCGCIIWLVISEHASMGGEVSSCSCFVKLVLGVG